MTHEFNSIILLRGVLTVPKNLVLGASFLVLSTYRVIADYYFCWVTKKLNPSYGFSEAEIKKNKFSVKIEDHKEKSFLSRYSILPGEEKISCDRYEIDMRVNGEHVGVIKFYVFRSLLDIQLFRDMTFVQNNGRKGISFRFCGSERNGHCGVRN